MSDRPLSHEREERRERRRLRMRRHGRRAYIRSVYFLPSMATLGNAVCGFGAAYVAAMPAGYRADSFASFLAEHRFTAAAYLIFLAMVFDALDGRLARFARHTTDFGGQLDSMADVISFGVAPGLLGILLFGAGYAGPMHRVPPPPLSRLIWCIGALYMCCAAVRLARFNVSNEHGEQHHFSFLGLPSPGAGGMVAAWVLMQQDLSRTNAELLSSGDAAPWFTHLVGHLSTACLAVLPILVLGCGLLMVSQIRYPHLVNRYLKGRRSIGRLIVVLILALLIIVAHQYVIALAMVTYVLWGTMSAVGRMRRAKSLGVA
jgi:CDP-diacylglycerol--serine O-phosphatidyltransferase